eukprot:1593145-Prorocentrum_lima.AAC.1
MCGMLLGTQGNPHSRQQCHGESAKWDIRLKMVGSQWMLQPQQGRPGNLDDTLDCSRSNPL